MVAMFAPYAADAMARRIHNPNISQAYYTDARGSVQVAAGDVAWFQTQGFSLVPTALGGQSLMYAPYLPNQQFARPITNPNTGNSYAFNSAGSAAVAAVDVPWFQAQGFSLVPSPAGGQTVMYTQIEVGQSLSGPIFSPITNNMYVLNGQGFILAAAADVAWLLSQGFVASSGIVVPVLTSFAVSAPGSATTGTPFSFTVTAKDQFGSTFPGYAGTVHFTSSDGAASLPANSTLTSGTGTFSATLNTVGSQTITATDTVVGTVTGTSAPIAASAAASPPTVTSVTPNNGTTLGGTPVTVGGTNFTGATGVTFGGVAATSVVVVNATTITCVTPAGTAGAQNVVVTTPAGSGTGAGLYTYAALPTVTSVTPNNGAAAGATSVTVGGTNFTGATSVTFGGTAATSVVVVNATTITCVTPAHAAGAVNVIVTTPAGSGTGTGLYTYNAAPAFPPQVSGTNATLAADFVGSQYWASATTQANFAAWVTAISGTYARSSSATYTQGGVVKTATSGTPRFPTDLTSTALGLRLTGALTELCLQNRDLTNAAWTKTNVTAAKTQTGADGVANAASLLTATAANGTALQSITDASATHVMGAYVKRITGTGTINITQDNGATWTPITITSSFVFYSLPSATVANPVVGFRIVTSGDAIAVDYVSERAAPFVTDVIPTTTATVTQAADDFTIPFDQLVFTILIGSNDQQNVKFNTLAGHASGYYFVYVNDDTTFARTGGAIIIGPAFSGGVASPHKTISTGDNTTAWLTTDGAVPISAAGNLFVHGLNTIGIGYAYGGTNNANGNYSQFAIWNAVVASTSEMQRLTT